MQVFIQHKNMNPGGIETALASFLKLIKDDVDLTLFLFNKGGLFYNRLPNLLNIKEGNFIYKKINPLFVPSIEKEKRRFFRNGIKKLIKWLKLRNLLVKISLMFCKQKEFYDVAIAYHGLDYLSCKFVLKNVKARQKIVFIHADPGMVKFSKRQLKLISNFDKIILVSGSCKNNFNVLFPELACKSDFLYNAIDNDLIRKEANILKVEYPEKFNIVSVLRLAPEKGIIRALNAFREIRKTNKDFTWHIVGDGPEKEEIQKFIIQNDMSDYIKLLGNKNNPYPYIKQADLLFVPSFHESFGIVLIEAMILGRPVLTTRTCAAEEVVGERGFVCDNNEESIYKNLKYIMENQNILAKYRDKLIDYNFDTESIKRKFFRLVE